MLQLAMACPFSLSSGTTSARLQRSHSICASGDDVQQNTHMLQGAPALRVPSGVLRDRLSLILAVLSKHTPMKPFSVNVHTNVVAGLTMREPASDLAIAVAIASSYYERPVPADMAVIGEIGLAGEVRWADLIHASTPTFKLQSAFLGDVKTCQAAAFM